MDKSKVTRAITEMITAFEGKQETTELEKSLARIRWYYWIKEHRN